MAKVWISDRGRTRIAGGISELGNLANRYEYFKIFISRRWANYTPTNYHWSEWEQVAYWRNEASGSYNTNLRLFDIKLEPNKEFAMRGVAYINGQEWDIKDGTNTIFYGYTLNGADEFYWSSSVIRAMDYKGRFDTLKASEWNSLLSNFTTTYYRVTGKVINLPTFHKEYILTASHYNNLVGYLKEMRGILPMSSSTVRKGQIVTKSHLTNLVKDLNRCGNPNMFNGGY